jgi:hypothetical protein
MNNEELKNTLSYIKSELDRVQTIAGTLSGVETQHYKDLTDVGDDKLNQVATEEQSAARQLGEVKQVCLTLSQKMDDLEQQFGESNV